MSVKSRKKRLLHFDEKAGQFPKIAGKGGADGKFRLLERDGKKVVVGAGDYRRLILKPHPLEARHAQELQKNLISYLASEKIQPQYYILEPVMASKDTKVMEYFNSPSISELRTYLEVKETEKARGKAFRLKEVREMAGWYRLTRDEWFLCKRFSRQNPSITLDRLNKASMELYEDLSCLEEDIEIDETNVIILGETKNQKLRLAIVDV